MNKNEWLTDVTFYTAMRWWILRGIPGTCHPTSTGKKEISQFHGMFRKKDPA